MRLFFVLLFAVSACATGASESASELVNSEEELRAASQPWQQTNLRRLVGNWNETNTFFLPTPDGQMITHREVATFSLRRDSKLEGWLEGVYKADSQDDIPANQLRFHMAADAQGKMKIMQFGNGMAGLMAIACDARDDGDSIIRTGLVSLGAGQPSIVFEEVWTFDGADRYTTRATGTLPDPAHPGQTITFPLGEGLGIRR